MKKSKIIKVFLVSIVLICCINFKSYADQNINNVEVKYISGNWRAVVNGVVDYKYNGIGKNENGTWYVKNGTIKFDYTGTIWDGEIGYIIEGNKVYEKVKKDTTKVMYINETWRMVKNGVVDYNYNGIGKNENGTWVLQNGKVDFKYYGVYKDLAGDSYIVEGSKILTEETSVKYIENNWRYVKNGKIIYDFEGIASNENGTWYVKKGTIKFDYTGTIWDGEIGYIIEGNRVYEKVKKDTTKVMYINELWRMVKNGVVDYNYNGIGKNENGTWVLQNAKVDFKYYGVYKDKSGDSYLVERSQILTEETSVKYIENNWRYVKNGKIIYDYDGIASNENGTWYVKNGTIKFDYTGTIWDGEIGYIIEGNRVYEKVKKDTTKVMYINETWRMVKNGVVDYNYNGIGENENGVWLLENGKVTFKYTGKYTDKDGNTYYIKNSKVINNSVDININESKYPGLKSLIEKLQSSHPTWNFEILYTGVNFEEAVNAEYLGSNKKTNLVDSTVYKGDWIASNPYSSGVWYSASYNAIAYFMDSRNFLNDTDIFQFLDLNKYDYNSVNLNGIQEQVKGTFLEKYANDINNACIKQNVNPYYVIARLFQEQGKRGSATACINGGDGKYYYNPFNIGALVGKDVETALAKAKEKGWDSMEKAIIGGIDFLKVNWLENYQNTLYQNKFDIDSRNGTSLYTHQYMQNLSAAYSEARSLRSCYTSSTGVEQDFTFIIPVYENMPEKASSKPTGISIESTTAVITSSGPQDFKTTENLNIRKEATTSSNIITTVSKGTELLSVKRVVDSENTTWHQVVLDDGTIGYAHGKYLQVINDRINCNVTKTVITSGSNLNVRIGPSTSLDKKNGLSSGTVVTVINEGKYNIDGYLWSRIILNDGTQGFVVNSYLK